MEKFLLKTFKVSGIPSIISATFLIWSTELMKKCSDKEQSDLKISNNDTNDAFGRCKEKLSNWKIFIIKIGFLFNKKSSFLNHH